MAAKKKSVAKKRVAQRAVAGKAAAGKAGARKSVASSASAEATSASRQIDARIAELNDWRGETLARMRALIRAADPDVLEEWKWDVPVWSHDGLICTGETYKKAVKLTFAKGASLPDPSRLFNSSLDGNVRRAIDVAEGASVDEAAFKRLIQSAVALNRGGKAR